MRILFGILSRGERQRNWRAQRRATGMAGAGEERLKEMLCSPWKTRWRGLKPTLYGPWGLHGPCKGRRHSSNKGNWLYTKTRLFPLRAAQPWDRTQRGGGTSILKTQQQGHALDMPETELIKPLETGNPLLFLGSCFNLKNQESAGGPNQQSSDRWGRGATFPAIPFPIYQAAQGDRNPAV